MAPSYSAILHILARLYTGVTYQFRPRSTNRAEHRWRLDVDAFLWRAFTGLQQIFFLFNLLFISICRIFFDSHKSISMCILAFRPYRRCCQLASPLQKFITNFSTILQTHNCIHVHENASFARFLPVFGDSLRFRTISLQNSAFGGGWGLRERCRLLGSVGIVSSTGSQTPDSLVKCF